MNQNLLKYLNTPIKANKYLASMLIILFLMLCLTTVLRSAFLVILLLIIEIIFIRKRLMSIGWSTWWSLICLTQLLVLINENELGPMGEFLLYLILPGFIILLYFTNKHIKSKL
jgi:uncharacterized membrane protein YhaH (DUF805 family)